MKKKLLSLFLVVVLAVTSVVTGTLASAVDAVNTDGGTQTDETTVDIENVGVTKETPQKLVSGVTLEQGFRVKNVGTEQVFVRTWIAVESDTTDFSNLFSLTWGEDFEVKDVGTATIDGVKYDIYLATYKDCLTPGMETPVSLERISMNASAGKEQVDQFGDDFRIMVISQAVGAPDAANGETLSADTLTALWGKEHPFE